MKFEELNRVRVPKIGFGTYRIGGGITADRTKDDISRAALRSAVELGYTHFDTAEIYAGGHAEELLGETIRELRVNRADLFITSKVSPEHLNEKGVLSACEKSLRRLETDNLDLYLIHWPNPLIKLEGTFKALNLLVREGKVKHVGVSNFKLKDLKKAVELCETPLLTDQVPYSLPEKTYVENGVLEFCQLNNILLTAYSPVKFRNLNVNQTLKNIAEAHNATSYQIALAWLVSQSRVITIPMSMDARHQQENLTAAEIELMEEEIKLLNSLY